MSEPRDPEEPLPYGLPPETREPYFDVLYPNLDKVAGASFDSATVNGRRGRRGLIVVTAVVGICVVIAGIGILIQTVTGAVN